MDVSNDAIAVSPTFFLWPLTGRNKSDVRVVVMNLMPPRVLAHNSNSNSNSHNNSNSNRNNNNDIDIIPDALKSNLDTVGASYDGIRYLK